MLTKVIDESNFYKRKSELLEKENELLKIENRLLETKSDYFLIKNLDLLRSLHLFLNPYQDLNHLKERKYLGKFDRKNNIIKDMILEDI